MKRVVSGLLLGVAGIVFTIVAVFIAQAAQDQNRLTERNYMTADAACREQAQKLGAIKEIEAGRVWELTVPVVVDKRTALGDASAVIAACPTRTMHTFCLGSGCNDPEGVRPPAMQARRPASMIMRLVLRPGAVPAQPMAQSTSAPRPAGPVAPQGAQPPQVSPRPAQPPPAGAQQQPARPQQQPPQQPARPLQGVVQPQSVPQVK
jgi:hypothetical protein